MEHEIRKVEERLWAAMLASDVAVLDELVDEQLLFVGPDGGVYRKADDLALHRSGTQRMTRLDVDEVLVEVHGTMAIAVVRARIAGSMGGAPFEGTFRWVRTWLRRETGWRIVAGGVCAVAG